MPDYILLNEGADYLNNHGWPATPYFLLSTKSVASQVANGTTSTTTNPTQIASWAGTSAPVVGQSVSGTGITAGSTVTAVAGTSGAYTVTMSIPANASGTSSITIGGNGSSTFAATDTLAGAAPANSGEITGTGYARASQAAPTSSNGVMSFVQMSFATGANTNWPIDVCSLVAVTSTDNTGKMLIAWDLVTGGIARNMAAANTTEQVTPTYTLT